MLVYQCYLKDIKEYEQRTRKNILRLFDNLSVSNMVEIISIFFKGMTEEEACLLIDDYMMQNNKGIWDVFNELRDALLGYSYLEDKKDREDKEAEENKSNLLYEGSAEDIKTYNFLSDYYMHLCMQMMSLGVTYTEFWSFTTKEMYIVFKGLEQKTKLEFNKQMQIAYLSAGLNAGAMLGKLPDEAPQMELGRSDGKKEEDIIINHPKYGEISRADLKNLGLLESM